MPKGKIRNLKLLVMDVDGVMTDGIYYSNNGEIAEKFNTKDGIGTDLWHAEGLKTMIISGSNLKLIEDRAKLMKINYVLIGKEEKYPAVKEVIDREGIKLEEIAYIGDDINDLPLLKVAGFSASVVDGMDVVKRQVDYVTKRRGGDGAVREFIDYLLEQRKKK